MRANESELALAYGAPRLLAPRYDLALLAPQILGASAEEVDPLPERAGPVARVDEHTDVVQHRVFWGVLAAAVLALLLVLVRVLRIDDGRDAA